MGGVLPWIWWAEELGIYRSYEKVFLYGGTHRPHVFIFLLVWVSSFSLLTPFWVWIFADTNPHLYIVFHGGFVGFFLDRKLRLLGKKGCFPESKRVSDFRVKTRCGKPNRKWDSFCEGHLYFFVFSWNGTCVLFIWKFHYCFSRESFIRIDTLWLSAVTVPMVSSVWRYFSNVSTTYLGN